MSLAAEAREAVRERPFLHDALRAGVVNYRAAADYLDLDGDPEAVATALRRYADELDPPSTRAASVSVRMQSGVGLADEVDAEDRETGDAEDVEDVETTERVEGAEGAERVENVVAVLGDRRVVRGGDMTALRARGEVDPRALSTVLARLRVAAVVVDAAAVVDDELVVVVPRRQGATALRVVEEALASVPT